MNRSHLPEQPSATLLTRGPGVSNIRKWMLCSIITTLATVFITPLPAQDDVVAESIVQLLRDMEKRGADAIKPLVIPANAANHKDITKAQQTWAERVWVNPALARIKKRTDAPWKDDAEKFLRVTPAAIFSERFISAPTELALSARKLVDAGCNDPAVLILAAMLDRRIQSDWRFVENCVVGAMQVMEKDPESKAVLTFYASYLSLWANKLGGFPKKQKTAADKFKKAALLMAQDGSFLPNEADLFIRHYLSLEREPGMPESMIQSAKKLPLPEWAQKTLSGEAYKDVAWDARGTGWSNTVTDAGWKGFAENLQKARAELAEAWKLNPQSPIAASHMIAIVMAGLGEKDDTLQLWFERAIAAQCDYRLAYKSMLLAYRPRWSGGHELMLAFGKACAATKRYDLDVPVFFTLACNDIIGEKGDWRAFYRRPDVAKVLIEVSEGLVREPSRQNERAMRLSFLAVNAWLTGDTKRAALALAELKGPLHPDAANQLAIHRTNETEFREEIAIAQSPVAADYKKAMELYEKYKIADAETIFQRIKGSAPQDLQGHIQELLGLIDLEKKLATGEWVRLPVDPSLRGWIQRGGNWTGAADGKLINQGNDGRGFIVHRARVGPDFEMRVEYSVKAQQKCCQHCDIVFGWYAGFQEPFNVAFHGQNGTAAANAWISSNQRQTQQQIKKVNAPIQANNVMLLHSKDQKLTFTINGKEAFRDFNHDDIDFGPEEACVGIGSYRWCRMNVTDITKIEVRKLTD